MSKHEEINASAVGGPHSVRRFVFANASAKTALTDTNKGTLTLTSADVGSVAHVVADNKFYIIDAVSGGGTPTWFEITAAGGTPGGSDTYVQFNDSGAFAGDATLLFNKTSDTLTIKNCNITSLAGAAGGVLTIAAGATASQVILSEGAAPSTPSGATSVYTSAKKVVTTLDEDAVSRTLYGTRPVNGVRVNGEDSTQFLKIPDAQVVPAGSDGSLMWLSMWSVIPQREVISGGPGGDNGSLMCLGAGIGGDGDDDQLDYYLKKVDEDLHSTIVYWGGNLDRPGAGGNENVSREGSLPSQAIVGHVVTSAVALADGDIFALLYSPGGCHIPVAYGAVPHDLDLSAAGAQIGTMTGRVEGVVTGVCSIDCTSGFPFARQDELMRALQIWHAEGEFRSLAAGELSGGVASGVTSGAVGLHRVWKPGGIVSDPTSGVVTGWTEGSDTPVTAANMTVEGSWTAGPFISQQLWRP